MDEHGGSTIRSLVIVVAIALSFLAWGLLIFFSVGDKGSPTWDFGILEDIPGESAYSTHSRKAPEPEAQHVFQKPRAIEGEEKGGKP